MSNKDKAKLFINIISSALNGESFGFRAEDPDYILKLAEYHDMVPIYRNAVKENKTELSAELCERIESKYSRTLYKLAAQELMYENLSAAFENAGIKHLALKGMVFRKMYPKSEMRTSGDVDVFYCESDEDGKLSGIMSSLGFKHTKHSPVVDTYSAHGGVVFEMHKKIAENFTLTKKLESETWDSFIKVDGKNYEYTLSFEDLYVYHIAHLAKHFTGKGCGIRPVCDIYVYWQKLGGKVDREYIDAALSELGYTKFESAFKKLAYAWFGKGEYDNTVNALEDSILFTGVHGNMSDMAVLDKIKKESGRGNHRFIKAFFLPLSQMEVKYPILKKAPVLLPVFWCTRAASALFKKRKLYADISKSYADADKEKIDAKKKLFTDLGI